MNLIKKNNIQHLKRPEAPDLGPVHKCGWVIMFSEQYARYTNYCTVNCIAVVFAVTEH